MYRSITLAALLAAVCFAGCSNKTVTSNPSASADKDDAQAASSDSATSIDSALAALIAKQASSPLPAEYAEEKPVTYKVRQIVHLSDIPEGSKDVRMWVSVPGDDPNQRVHELKIVSAPGESNIVDDLEHRASLCR